MTRISSPYTVYDEVREVGSTQPVAYIDPVTDEMLYPWEVPWYEPDLPKNYAKVAAE